MHSLVILKDDRLLTEDELTDKMYIDKDGTWEIWDKDLYFGRTQPTTNAIL